MHKGPKKQHLHLSTNSNRDRLQQSNSIGDRGSTETVNTSKSNRSAKIRLLQLKHLFFGDKQSPSGPVSDTHRDAKTMSDKDIRTELEQIDDFHRICKHSFAGCGRSLKMLKTEDVDKIQKMCIDLLKKAQQAQDSAKKSPTNTTIGTCKNAIEQIKAMTIHTHAMGLYAAYRKFEKQMKFFRNDEERLLEQVKNPLEEVRGSEHPDTMDMSTKQEKDKIQASFNSLFKKVDRAEKDEDKTTYQGTIEQIKKLAIEEHSKSLDRVQRKFEEQITAVSPFEQAKTLLRKVRAEVSDTMDELAPQELDKIQTPFESLRASFNFLFEKASRARKDGNDTTYQAIIEQIKELAIEGHLKFLDRVQRKFEEQITTFRNLDDKPHSQFEQVKELLDYVNDLDSTTITDLKIYSDIIYNTFQQVKDKAEQYYDTVNKSVECLKELKGLDEEYKKAVETLKDYNESYGGVYFKKPEINEKEVYAIIEDRYRLMSAIARLEEVRDQTDPKRIQENLKKADEQAAQYRQVVKYLEDAAQHLDYSRAPNHEDGEHVGNAVDFSTVASFRPRPDPKNKKAGHNVTTLIQFFQKK